mmetsp:Transcript_6752/g.9449  ORF Transcript_6752/g.9449 Transcript_6752/m.9449 type:complete len:98 (+) Transcript_6752:64-357(+)|eukprot:CAMPEP_0197286072 /NCGR_PEP_ID=MMETSP0890-20130614/1505_1 /TAXON_ID=44058 ORGANISM="Aureoumbra lagunensis, Strain CCMP1510" /NCGR_SAMPLE_ID=MMETSP0890 /ASSEMBLY_ACC=CAM_ASM_000533 /LENGTH=97 /DNA_ID=CAMNT_0042754153 /DNA_START=62 /DNA_END=355 /DNA_ORIENTATION=+
MVPPRFRLSKMQIIYTTVMFVPGLATWLLLRPDKRSDEQFHASLERAYPQHVAASKRQRQELQTFFDKMKAGDSEQEAQFDSVLRQGKNHIKPRQER